MLDKPESNGDEWTAIYFRLIRYADRLIAGYAWPKGVKPDGADIVDEAFERLGNVKRSKSPRVDDYTVCAGVVRSLVWNMNQKEWRRHNHEQAAAREKSPHSNGASESQFRCEVFDALVDEQEIEFLSLRLDGLTNEEIAQRMRCSTQTVSRIQKRLIEKLQD